MNEWGVRIHLACPKFTGVRPVLRRIFVLPVADSGPATRGVGRRQLGGRRLGLGAVADSGVRGGDAKERTDRAQEEEAEAEEEWRKRESVVGGGASRQWGKK